VVKQVTALGCHGRVIDTTKLELADGEDSVDWLKRNPGAGNIDILRLPTGVSFGQPAPGDHRHASSAVALLDEEIGVISSWCADRCLRDDRALGATPALYRDFCAWHGPDFALAPSEFAAGLTSLGVQVESGFAKGMALFEDLRVPGVAPEE